MDFDGTIHVTASIYAPALQGTVDELAADGVMAPRLLSEAEVAKWIGAPGLGFWDEALPDADPGFLKKCYWQVGLKMKEQLLAGTGRLYEGTADTLTALKERGVTLCILSNSIREYMDMCREAYGLDRFYDEYFVISDFPVKTKAEMLAAVMPRYEGRPMFVTGDRFYDLEAAASNGLPFIACEYGYAPAGELDGARFHISDIRELTEIPGLS